MRTEEDLIARLDDEGLRLLRKARARLSDWHDAYCQPDRDAELFAAIDAYLAKHGGPKMLP